MKLYRKLTVWTGPTFLILCLIGLTAQAETTLTEPQLIVQETSNKLQSAMKANPPSGNYERASQIVSEIIEPHIDFTRVSALVLGKHWKRANPGQRQSFKKEFRELLIRTYAVAFSEYAEWDIEYVPLKINPDDKKVLVKTQIIRPGAPPIAVNYRMIHKKDNWKVYDVVIEGISFIKNYRTTFKNEVARSGSLDSVIARLAKRNSKSAQSTEKES